MLQWSSVGGANLLASAMRMGVVVWAGWFAVAARTAVAVDPPKRPDVLLICIDDLRPELGCYGAAHMETPQIDRLASSGVAFDRCYVQVAVCNPSRASTWTGLRPARLNVYDLRVHFRETMPDAVTVFQHLRNNGYHCESLGKIFHNPWPDPQSWDRPHEWGEGSYTHYTPEQQAFRKKVEASLPTDAWQKGNLRGVITNDPDIDDAEHRDGSLTLKSIERMKALQNAGNPYLLAVGLTLPHLPWASPKSWWDRYDRQTLPLPTIVTPPDGAPEIAVGTNYELSHYADMVEMPTPYSGTLSESQTRRLRHAYFASVSFVDAQVGKLLDALDESGRRDDTVVILWSDHGYKLGELNGWGKMTNYEIDTRIPLIIRDPRAAANGLRCNQLVESLDVFPTICELTGAPVPDEIDGRSVVPLLKNPDGHHHEAAFSQYVRKSMIGNAMRTDRWRYVEWRRMDDASLQFRELYDHQLDPGETRNVVADHPEQAERLSERMGRTLIAEPIDLRGTIRSRQGGTQKQCRWINGYPGPVRITWINPRGQRKKVWKLEAGEDRDLRTFEGHVFAVESLDGRYHQHVRIGNDRELRLGS
ncbi:sulfatase-like hydrolase/transferase [Roseiconus nitratireducens]|uniref:sulfatase-like hydrolase/transferase n=1 Tax=Roseiconus nitratireducens TaxID=2605748 RepID=UPI001375562D|nr:sulfatase-like hydrolase/transferase [Roseiconus nitratireducens]